MTIVAIGELSFPVNVSLFSRKDIGARFLQLLGSTRCLALQLGSSAFSISAKLFSDFGILVQYKI